MTRVVGVLLAAGAARRFGAPKQLAVLDGRPLVSHALTHLLAMEELSCVLVVVGSHGEAVSAAVGGDPRVRIVVAEDWQEGLAASLRAGVAAADARGADAVLIHLADLPRITADVMRMVAQTALDELAAGSERPVRACFGGEPGHPVVLPRSRFGLVAHLQGDTGLRSILGGSCTVRVEVGHLADPTDVDIPEHLEALQS